MKVKELIEDIKIEFILSGPEFIDYFQKFNNTFKKKEKPYKKITYNVWTDLNKHDSGVPVSIVFWKQLSTIYVYAGKKISEEVRKGGTSFSDPYFFVAKDSSFGGYLYDAFIKKEVEKMTYNAYIKADNGTISSCSTNSVSAVDTLAASKVSTYYDGLTIEGINSNYGTTAKSVYVGDENCSYDKVATYNDLNALTTNYSYLSTKIACNPTMDDVDDKFREHEEKYHKNKENEKMKFGNFDFGPCTNDNVRMSMYGLAVKNASGTWVSYDTNSGSIMDVDIFNFDGAKFLYKMPVAIKDVKPGDVIIHAKKPMFVNFVKDKFVTAVDPVDGELKDIILTQSPFGFNFVVKVVNFVEGMMPAAAAPSETNPFGNMWMLMLMNDNKTDDLMPLLLMSQGGNMNPMMMYALMGDNKNFKDILPLMMFSQMNK